MIMMMTDKNIGKTQSAQRGKYMYALARRIN